MFTARDSLKMQWITTGARFANVMQMQSCGNLANEQFVNQPMDVIMSFGSANIAVTKIVDIATPKPASGIGLRINLLLNAFGQRAKFNSHHADLSVAETLRWGQFIYGES